MSINVTVSGNPISIKNGKMVSADPNLAKKEFDKRRLMRLEQVRQQSKDIAEDVRNRVRREKKRQMREIENEGKEKLKNWQNRKLLQLQSQYEEALQEIGTAHAEADEFEDEEYQLNEQQELDKAVAKRRGYIAKSKMQEDRNADQYKKAIPAQQKKIVRDIENTRAKLVSNMDKSYHKRKNGKPQKRKVSADINITIPDSDSEEANVENIPESGGLPRILEEDYEISQYDYTKTIQNPTRTVQEPVAKYTEFKKPCDCNSASPKTSNNVFNHKNHETKTKSNTTDLKLDTRISERIRRREVLASQPDYCDEVAVTNPFQPVQSTSKLRTYLESRPLQTLDNNQSEPYIPLGASVSQQCTCNKNQPPDWAAHEQDYISQEQLFENYSNGNIPQQKNRYVINEEPEVSSRFPVKIKPDDKLRKSGDATNAANLDWTPSEEINIQQNKPAEKRSSANNPPLKNKHGINDQLEISMRPAGQLKPEENIRKSGEATNAANSNWVPHQDFYKQQNKQVEKRLSTNTSPHKNKYVRRNHQDVPSRPPVKLKPDDKFRNRGNTISATSSKIQYYDHPNRLYPETDADSASIVKKIGSESIEVIPNAVSEAEYFEKMQQRDRDAEMRGKKALEKEKVRRDYEEMMKKLPLLQKKERICEISKDKPEYHMSEDRLKEKERKRQNKLENVYSKVIPNLQPAVVTLPSKHTKETGTEPFRIIDADDASRSMNVGKWDTDYNTPKMFTAQEVQEIIKTFTNQEPQDRQSKLRELLKGLKAQKQQLISEIQALPKDDSINALINDLLSINEAEEPNTKRKSYKEKKKEVRKRKKDETEYVSSTESTLSSDTPQKETDKSSRKRTGKKTPSRSKLKIKSRKKVLILQNMSTQTTPKLATAKDENETTAKPTACSKYHVPCDCVNEINEQPAEVCQILINLNENEEPNVLVKSGGKVAAAGGNKENIKDVEINRKDISKEKITEKDTEIIKEKRPKPKPSKVVPEKPEKVSTKESHSGSKLWRENLSSTSTSYYSPPDFMKMKESISISTTTDNLSKSSLYNLRRKPQQSNLDEQTPISKTSQSSSFGSSIDPELLRYIKKLLSMSRVNIDELAVSSSDVQTPSQSVVEMDTNNPVAELHNIIKYLNIKALDLDRNQTSLSDNAKSQEIPPDLSYSTDTPEKHYNSPVGSQTMQTPADQIDSRVLKPEKDGATESISKDSILGQYTDVTDCCSKRIASLAAMIKQLREEKVRMLQSPAVTLGEFKPISPSASDIDYSTKYLDIKSLSGEKSKESSKHTTSTLEDEEINRKLLEIDMSLAKKLRTFSPPVEEINAHKNTKTSSLTYIDVEIPGEEDMNFMMRLQRLIEPKEKENKASTESFVSFLSDIPKLPKLDTFPMGTVVEVSNQQKRPPPSKGLNAAKKFNGDISLVPHELSTIVEADSQISAKAPTPLVSPKHSKTTLTPTRRKSIEGSTHVKTSEVKADCKDTDKSTQNHISRRINETPSSDLSAGSSMSSCENTSCSRTINLPSCKISSSVSSNSSDNLESIEAMLRSIGMEWAIPTLHKTQEALALTSSYSSTSFKKSTSGSSELSLKDFLQKQLMDKISSSSLLSNASPGSANEFSNLSAIQKSTSISKKKQRTSTPINGKCANKSKCSEKRVMFPGESELSSVRDTSDKPSFYSLGEDQSSRSRSN